MRTIAKRTSPLRGEITVPGDKSISHRSVMFGALGQGDTHVTGFLEGADCLATIDCFRRLGVEIDLDRGAGSVTVHGKGMRGLSPALDPAELYTGNSGTTTRIISGILAPQRFRTLISGDESIATRPMNRIITPLRQMGAQIESVSGNGCAPLMICGTDLHGISYDSPVASAQVKSAILCAGLYADSPTFVTEPALSRDHTERMLREFGAEVISEHVENGFRAGILPCETLHAARIHVPGDISSAAYFIAAATIIPGSEILIRNVGINPTRAGILQAAIQMGADITLLNETNTAEPAADLLVRYAPLHGTDIGGDIIPTLIDEIPVLALMAACAQGRTVIRDAAELKVKETNRIDTVTSNLLRMGCNVTPAEDGFVIEGSLDTLHGARVSSYGDHRIAMTFAIAALLAGSTEIEGDECVDVSYPDFYRTLESL